VGRLGGGEQVASEWRFEGLAASGRARKREKGATNWARVSNGAICCRLAREGKALASCKCGYCSAGGVQTEVEKGQKEATEAGQTGLLCAQALVSGAG